jgi:hypothetical protein
LIQLLEAALGLERARKFLKFQTFDEWLFVF